MHRFPLVLLLLGALSLPLPATAQAAEFPRPASSPFTIQLDGPFAGGYYSNLVPNLAFDRQGGYVAVWSRSPGGSSDVVGRLFTARGKPRGPIFRVNSLSSGTQFNQGAQVAMSPRGGFVVAWTSGNRIHAQLFTAGGATIGKEIVVATTGAEGFAFGGSALGIDQAGEFAVAWGGKAGVRVRRFGRDGSPLGPELVASSADTFSAPAIAMQRNGGFFLSWVSASSKTGLRVVGRHFERSAEALGEEFQINASPLLTRGPSPAAALTPAEDFVVSWQSCPAAVPDAACQILARRYDSNADPSSAELVVSQEDGRSHAAPVLAADARGNVLIAWHSCPAPLGLGDCDISVRAYDVQGEPAPEVVTLTAANDLEDAAVAAGPAGFAVVYDTLTCTTPGCDTDITTGVFGWRFDLPAGR